ncbi:hypothetical protein [Albidovulum sp.]
MRSFVRPVCAAGFVIADKSSKARKRVRHDLTLIMNVADDLGR